MVPRSAVPRCRQSEERLGMKAFPPVRSPHSGALGRQPCGARPGPRDKIAPVLPFLSIPWRSYQTKNLFLSLVLCRGAAAAPVPSRAGPADTQRQRGSGTPSSPTGLRIQAVLSFSLSPICFFFLILFLSHPLFFFLSCLFNFYYYY